MLLQRAGAPGGTRSPTGFLTPDWEALAAEWSRIPEPASPTVTIMGPTTVPLGHDDFEAEDHDPVKTLEIDNFEFGWDNEHPKREVPVDGFKIEWRPVSNGQFYEFWKGDGKGRVKLPASWIEIDGVIQVSSVPYFFHILRT